MFQLWLSTDESDCAGNESCSIEEEGNKTENGSMNSDSTMMWALGTERTNITTLTRFPSSFDVSLITDESDCDMNVDNVIVGNNTFEYNKKIAKGGPYCSENGMFVEEDETSYSNVSEISEYESQFKPNSGDFLTNTLLDELEDVREFELESTFRSITTLIERKVSVFI